VKFFEITYKFAIISLGVALWIAIIFAVYGALFESIEEEVPGQQFSSRNLDEFLHAVEAEEKEQLNAASLQKLCDSKQSVDDAFCVGYLLGFSEGHALNSNFSICGGDALQSADQAEKAFSNYMEDHPQHWKKGRSFILGAALQKAFPCSDR
jgi:hypothetical protein